MITCSHPAHLSVRISLSLHPIISFSHQSFHLPLSLSSLSLSPPSSSLQPGTRERDCFYLLRSLCKRGGQRTQREQKGRGKKVQRGEGKKNQWKAKRTGDYRTIINLMTLLCCNTPEIFWVELFKCLQHKRVAGYTASATRLSPPANTDTRAPAACMNFTGIYRA